MFVNILHNKLLIIMPNNANYGTSIPVKPLHVIFKYLSKSYFQG